jgi:chromosomal replication initiation ATPase DnaA
MSIIEELHQARRERHARFRQATLKHFDRCYDEAQALISKSPPMPIPPIKRALVKIEAAPLPFRLRMIVPSIQSAVCARFNITHEQLVGPSKKTEFVRPRQIAMYVTRKVADIPLIRLGKIFGGRDHTTALFAIRSVERMMAEDAEYAAVVNEVCAEFGA